VTYPRRVLLLDEELLPVARVVGLFLRTVDDPLPTARIASELGISESTALRALRALEERGWVRRVHSLWAPTGDAA
jgi:DNA-binding MarR family transcriptional regulator